MATWLVILIVVLAVLFGIFLIRHI